MSLNTLFPDLQVCGHRVTSPADPSYNCVAWAAGDDQRWWEPLPGYYWPPGATRSSAVKSLIELFGTLGYAHCPDQAFEAGYEKVAIYAIQGSYTHTARQLPTGAWTSKIGGMEDMEHGTLDGLCGAEYGMVVFIMRRST